jgi:hypothetical protein
MNTAARHYIEATTGLWGYDVSFFPSRLAT